MAKASLPTYNTQCDFNMYTADFLFDKITKETDKDKFCKFFKIVCDSDWMKKMNDTADNEQITG